MTDWFEKAACKEVPSEIFYPDGKDKETDKHREAMAKNICRRCPVAAECLMYAIQNEENYGIWGSYAPKDRRNLLELFSLSAINIDLCRAVVNKEIKTIRAKIYRGDANW